MRRALLTLAMMTAAAVLLTGCRAVTGPAATTVSATFDDVADLVVDGSVRLNDVVVGSIGAIELTDQNHARVTMRLAPDAPIPADVTAMLAKTSVLGERYVDLVPAGDAACCLADGAVIAQTDVRTDLEDLVASGSDLLIGVSADAVATTITTAADAVSGRTATIGAFIDNVNLLVGTLDDNRGDLVGLIDSLDRLTAAYAPNAAANAAVLDDLRAAGATLAAEDDQLLTTLDDLDTLSGQAAGFLSTHQQEIQDTVRRLRKVLQQVAAADGDVRGLLEYGPLYALLLDRRAINGEVQIWLDAIVCGVDETPGDPSRDCTPPNPGTRAPFPPYFPVPQECFENAQLCTGRED